MPPLPDTHPDGDPFAEADAERNRSSLVGRLEARALAEAAAQQQDQDQPVAFAPPRPPSKPASSNRTSLGVGPNGVEIVLVDSDDSDEAEAEATDGEEDDEDDGEDGSSVASGEGQEGSEQEGQQPGVGEEGSEEEDSEDDDSDDDSSSVASGSRQGEDGDGDVTMGDHTSPAKPKSPVKTSAANGEASGSGAEGDGDGAAAGAEGDKAEGDKPKDGEGKKEKKKRQKRAHPRSPTPPPLAPKPPPPTIRLSVSLPSRASPSVPQYNVVELAKAAGIIIEEEPVKKPDDSATEGEDSESDGEGGRRKKKGNGKEKAEGDEQNGEGEDGSGPPKKRRKRGPNVILGRFGGYDTADPFVDDSEIQLYEPRHYHAPKREGFFVGSGLVECAPRRGRVKGSKNKPKVDENGNPVPAARRQSKKFVVGPDGKPVEGDEAGPSTAFQAPLASSIPAFGSTGPVPPPKKVRKPGEFSPDLQADLDMLRAESAKESYEVKNKFPPHLRELLTSVAYHALDLDEYDDQFFAELPKIFPYNLFTMKKLVKREVFSKRINDMTQQQEEHLAILKASIDETYPTQKLEFDSIRAKWEKEMEEKGKSVPPAGGEGAKADEREQKTPEPQPAVPAFGAASPAINTPGIGGEDSPAPGTDGPAGEVDGEPAEPKWRFRFNNPMRDAMYHACDLEDKKSDLIIEKQTLEKATTREQNREKPYIAKNARKAMYQKILDMWPPEMMTTNQISREISNYKLKLKKHGEIDA
ncbi:hypothetical protein JCM1840_001252 [Sporobolomyces johnsonii]